MAFHRNFLNKTSCFAAPYCCMYVLLTLVRLQGCITQSSDSFLAVLPNFLVTLAACQLLLSQLRRGYRVGRAEIFKLSYTLNLGWDFEVSGSRLQPA